MMQFDDIERRIAIGCIYNADFVRRIRHRLELKLFQSAEVRNVVRVAVRAYDRLQRVVGDEFLGYIELALNNDKDRELAEIFYHSIRPDEKSVVVDVLVDNAILYFARRKLDLLVDELQTASDAGDVETAKRILDEFQLPMALSTEPEPILAPGVVDDMFRQHEPLFRYGGNFGAMLNRFFVRDSFVAILAPEKRGKTWWLIEFAMRAVKSGLRVAFFEVGDMSAVQLRRRFVMYLLQRPFAGGRVLYPQPDCLKNVIGNCALPHRAGSVPAILVDGSETVPDVGLSVDAGYTPCVACAQHGNDFPLWGFPTVKKFAPVDIETVRKLAAVWDKKLAEKYGGDVKMFVYPANSVSPAHIDTVLQEQRDVNNWVPDVVVIDYADLLAPNRYYGEYRHQINDVWANLRALSTKWNVLLITATQSNVRGHRDRTLDQLNFSEDKRKMAHVTAMIGLNQTPDEKRVGIMRVNVIVARETDFDPRQSVAVLTAPGIGRPILKEF